MTDQKSAFIRGDKVRVTGRSNPFHLLPIDTEAVVVNIPRPGLLEVAVWDDIQQRKILQIVSINDIEPAQGCV